MLPTHVIDIAHILTFLIRFFLFSYHLTLKYTLKLLNEFSNMQIWFYFIAWNSHQNFPFFNNIASTGWNSKHLSYGWLAWILGQPLATTQSIEVNMHQSQQWVPRTSFAVNKINLSTGLTDPKKNSCVAVHKWKRVAESERKRERDQLEYKTKQKQNKHCRSKQLVKYYIVDAFNKLNYQTSVFCVRRFDLEREIQFDNMMAGINS